MSLFTEQAPLLVTILVAGFAMTYMWRFLGVLLARRFSIESPLLRWIELVAYALIAGLVARMLIFPEG